MASTKESSSAGKETLSGEKRKDIESSTPQPTGDDVGQGPTDTSSTPQKFLDKLPTWISTNLRSKKSLKLWIRCWVASWAAFVILLPNKSLSVLGNAAFFALLASLMLPPNLPVQLFIFMAMVIVLGLCVGWAIAAAGMAAALAARDQVALQQSLQREQQSVAGLSNPEALFQADIFQGNFLDTRSTVVYGVFLGFGVFIFALIRAYAPKLTLMSIFGTIAIDIYCSYGPLFPFAQYTLLNSFLISMSCYVAIGVIVTIFIFPETMNHALLTSTSDLLGQINTFIELQNTVLESRPEDIARGSPIITKLLGIRSGIVGKYQQMVGSSKFVTLEFSYGRWNGDDVKGLEEPLLGVISRLGSLQAFSVLLSRYGSRSTDASTETLPTDDGSDTVDETFVSESYLVRQLRARHQANEAQYSVGVVDVLPLIQESTNDLRDACSKGIQAAKLIVDHVNTKRYHTTDLDKEVAELSDATNRLKKAMEDFKETKRLKVLEPFLPILEKAKSHKKTEPLPLHNLYVAYVFGSNLMVLAEGIVNFMAAVEETANKRTRSRVWAPSSLRALGKAITSRGDTSEQALGEDTTVEKEDEAQRDEKSYKLDPDSKAPTNFMQRIANKVHSLYRWCKTNEAIFAFKYVILTIALWLPSVLKSSAHFVYAQKGLWALIMAQTTLNLYASDQIFNYVTRILGTFVGALLGLLNWYIGNAKGNGNPYGSAASVAAFLVPMIFLRLYAPPQYLTGAILTVVTWGLIMGYSWLDGHIPVFGNVGIGWPIVWRRWVMVMIGCAASFIVMMFPPQSGRTAVRRRNASNITAISYLYSSLVSAWISDKDRPNSKDTEWIVGFRDRLVAVATQLQAVKAQTEMAKWEGGIRGAWPYEEYVKMEEIETQMIAGLALLGGSLAYLDHSVRIKFLQHTRTVNPNFIADVMNMFSTISQALRTGEPLHQASQQNLIDRFHYHGTIATQSLAEENGESPLEAITDYNYMFYASAIVAVFQLLEGLQELRGITVRLVGEVPLEGLSRWRNEFERAHVLV